MAYCLYHVWVYTLNWGVHIYLIVHLCLHTYVHVNVHVYLCIIMRLYFIYAFICKDAAGYLYISVFLFLVYVDVFYLYVYIYTVYVTTKCCACYMLISLYIAIYIGTIGCQFAEHKCKFGEVPIETGIPNVKVTLAKNSCHSLLNHWGWKMYCWESGRCYVSFRTCIFWSFVRLVLNKC